VSVYGSKGAKFLTKLEFSVENKPGFWESRGYHHRADVWKEERLEDTPPTLTLAELLEQCTSQGGETLSLNVMSLPKVPSEIYTFSNLGILTMHNNQLTEIPKEVFICLPRLLTLGLNQNQITCIPPEIGLLNELEELYLSNNKVKLINLCL
jgi:Leucine-rich repeat (LRR) protein